MTSLAFARRAALVVGVCSFLLLTYAYPIVGIFVFLMLWSNNVMLETHRAEQERRNVLLDAALRKAAKEFVDKYRAGPAAPGGDAGNPGITNTEAEVAGEESP